MSVPPERNLESSSESADEGLGTSTFATNKHACIFNDMIHPHLELPSICYKIINTKPFQRLRNLKQLGLCYYVYPSASHNRFEHCIGTSYLAGKFIKHFQKNQPELNITEKDVLCLQIAGLLHDIGHGPFSHTWENFMAHFVEGYSHEMMSLRITEYVLKDCGIWDYFENENLDELDMIFIKEVILGHPLPGNDKFIGRGMDKYFLYQIVSNSETGIDADKFDYILRDCKMLSVSTAFDYERLIENSRVLSLPSEDPDITVRKIGYRKKIADNLDELFRGRSRLHKIAYQHRVTRIIEQMVVSGLLAAEPHFRIDGDDGKSYSLSTAHQELSAFMKLSDSIFEMIVFWGQGGLKACEIFQRVIDRDLFKSLGYLITPPPEILQELKSIDPDLTVVNTKINYGKGTTHPLNNALFYEKSRPLHGFHLTFDPPPMESKCYIVYKTGGKGVNISPYLGMREAERKLKSWVLENNLTLHSE